MRSTSRWIVSLVTLAGLGSIAWGQCNVNCCNQNCPERRTISVSGTGQVTADADLAVVHVGYKLFAPDAKTAYASALDTSNAVMQALTGSGIPKSAIESTSQVLQHTPGYELQPFPMKDDERQRRQFTVSQSWIIRVKPDQASAALNTAVDAGANESGWIQWIVEDPSTLQARAASDAVANARKIAEDIAARSGVHLGHLVSVNENQGPMLYNGFGGAVSGSIFGMGDAVMMAGAVPGMNQQLAINSRRVEFRTTLYAVFEIEDAPAAK
ncbi:MAG: SIMPL domain-containing protein [Terracidiphilus sp.]